MKYNVLCYGKNEFWVTPHTANFFKNLTDSERLEHVLCRVVYNPATKQEMLQHAEKIADYFEQVDTAKEAVIRCTKI